MNALTPQMRCTYVPCPCHKALETNLEIAGGKGAHGAVCPILGSQQVSAVAAGAEATRKTGGEVALYNALRYPLEHEAAGLWLLPLQPEPSKAVHAVCQQQVGRSSSRQEQKDH